MMEFLKKIKTKCCDPSKCLLAIACAALLLSCTSHKKNNSDFSLFSKDNLVAWCIVPFDSLHRTPEQRADMLNELGIKQLAYDWRAQHLSSFPEEIETLRRYGIKLKSVWLWIEADSGKIIDSVNMQVLEIIRQKNIHPDLWVGFSNSNFEGLSDDEKFEKAVALVTYIENRAKEIGCKIHLYNHGDWFGEPANQIRIIRKTGSKDIGIIYNFHHAHEQIEEFPSLLKEMLPYLNTVNLNGMNKNGPKILPIGQGEHDLKMLQILKESGFSGSIGVLGHVENDDVKQVLERNINGLKILLTKMHDETALTSY